MGLIGEFFSSEGEDADPHKENTDVLICLRSLFLINTFSHSPGRGCICMREIRGHNKAFFGTCVCLKEKPDPLKEKRDFPVSLRPSFLVICFLIISGGGCLHETNDKT